ncbi:MAG: radical SAM protein [Candidatus Hodarchaeota archaeon]
MGTCTFCGKTHPLISGYLQTCKDCLERVDPEILRPWLKETHLKARKNTDLGAFIPTSEEKPRCNLCSNNCSLAGDKKGFCGLHAMEGGKIKHLATTSSAFVRPYLDANPTNCCMAWTCPVSPGFGFPRYKEKEGIETGTYNYAVFFKGCNFNCLFCQNPDHQNLRPRDRMSLDDFIEPVLKNSKISCVCYFGGSPEPHLPFCIQASKKILEKIAENRVMRICWEWNGSGNPLLVKKCAKIALDSGGNLKFDLKAKTPILNEALCGTSNTRAFENFRMVGNEYHAKRKGLPVLGATTLLVPGYVDAEEVSLIAEYIAQVDPSIPYSLLVFHPAHHMTDLPIPSKTSVLNSKKSAEKHLQNVKVGNINLILD